MDCIMHIGDKTNNDETFKHALGQPVDPFLFVYMCGVETIRVRPWQRPSLSFIHSFIYLKMITH